MRIQLMAKLDCELINLGLLFTVASCPMSVQTVFGHIRLISVVTSWLTSISLHACQELSAFQ
jgi:hypothetical protein